MKTWNFQVLKKSSTMATEDTESLLEEPAAKESAAKEAEVWLFPFSFCHCKRFPALKEETYY